MKNREDGGDHVEEQPSLIEDKGEEIALHVQGGELVEKTGASIPRLKSPNRDQMVMKAIDVEGLVPQDHNVRAIWELVGSLDLSEFVEDVKAIEGGLGRPAWDPQLLISLWLYAYSDGVNSAREIERQCGHDPAYQWLAGLEQVNHHTLSDFRAKGEEQLDGLFAKVLGLLHAEGMIPLERVTQDGTKIKANASSKTFKREDAIRESIRLAQEHIKELDSIPEEEMTRRKAKARERAARERKETLQRALAELPSVRAAKSGQKEKENARVSISDPDARKMRCADGGFAAAYNVQITTDTAEKIIVAVGVTQSGNDYDGLEKGIDQVIENMGEAPRQVLVDGGYVDARNIIAMDRRGIDLIGALGNQHEGAATCQRRGLSAQFLPDKFVYDPQSDIYSCPAGKILHYVRDEVQGRKVNHQYQATAADCSACEFKNECCPKATKVGRSIMRGELLPEVAAMAAKMETEEAKAIYKQRGPVAEFPNAWIKDKFGLRQFRLRGLRKVKSEAIWACLTYNVQQWIRLRWRPALVA